MKPKQNPIGLTARGFDVLSSRAFSLVELIGVLAVMSILLSIVTPLLIENIDRSVAETEEDRLEEFAEGFVDYVTAFRSLPGTNDWASAIGGRLNP